MTDNNDKKIEWFKTGLMVLGMFAYDSYKAKKKREDWEKWNEQNNLDLCKKHGLDPDVVMGVKK